MTYDFFASRTDKLAILDFIFKETDLQIFDLGSKQGQNVCEYKSIEDLSSKFDLEIDEFGTTFQLYSERHKGKPIFKKIDLSPKYCDGPPYRYSTEGLGLIQLYFGGIKHNELRRSHLGHFNEIGASSTIYPFDKATNWDWMEIQKTSRRLKYYIHNKLAIKKIGSFGILEGALLLEKQGIKFR